MSDAFAQQGHRSGHMRGSRRSAVKVHRIRRLIRTGNAGHFRGAAMSGLSAVSGSRGPRDVYEGTVSGDPGPAGEPAPFVGKNVVCNSELTVTLVAFIGSPVVPSNPPAAVLIVSRSLLGNHDCGDFRRHSSPHDDGRFAWMVEIVDDDSDSTGIICLCDHVCETHRAAIDEADLAGDVGGVCKRCRSVIRHAINEIAGETASIGTVNRHKSKNIFDRQCPLASWL